MKLKFKINYINIVIKTQNLLLKFKNKAKFKNS